MNLVIDIGNTAIKYAIFNDNLLVISEKYSHQSVDMLINKLSSYPIDAAILSSVTQVNPELSTFFKKLNHFIFFNHETAIPIKNSYKTPKTLGVDRLANAVGAVTLFGTNHIVIIDVGTCLKFDFVHSIDGYLGGSISPGLKMRYKALHEFTSALPFLEPVSEEKLIGFDTNSSIHSGVINGMTAEIIELLRQYNNEFPDLTVVITGGDHHYFLNKLKTHIFASPKLTLIGLEAILRKNI